MSIHSRAFSGWLTKLVDAEGLSEQKRGMIRFAKTRLGLEEAQEASRPGGKLPPRLAGCTQKWVSKAQAHPQQTSGWKQ